MTPVWAPRYRLTPAMARSLMEVGAAAAVVEHLAIPPAIREELRHRARIRSTHYSTRIEGNRLTLAEAEQAIASARVRFHGRERDATYRHSIGNSSAIHRQDKIRSGRETCAADSSPPTCSRPDRSKAIPWRSFPTPGGSPTT